MQEKLLSVAFNPTYKLLVCQILLYITLKFCSYQNESSATWEKKSIDPSKGPW